MQKLDRPALLQPPKALWAISPPALVLLAPPSFPTALWTCWHCKASPFPCPGDTVEQSPTLQGRPKSAEMAANGACLIKYLQRTNFTLFKLTGSCNLQLCHLFGCCTAVLFPFVFQSPLTVSSHTAARDRRWQKGCRSKQVFSHTAAQHRGQSTKKPPSVPLPRPYHLAAPSPTHTNSCNSEPSPTKLSAADCPSHSINGTILPMPRQPEPSSFSMSPAPGCWLMGLETQGWLRDPGHRAGNCCSRGKGPLRYGGAGNAGGTIPICNSPP